MDLKQLRLRLGLDQREIAREMGVATRSVRRWENAEAEVPVGRLLPLARCLRVNVQTLMVAVAETQSVTATRIKTCPR